MFRVSLVLLFIITQIFSFAQSNEKVLPGIGFSDVQITMPIKKLNAILGEPINSATKEEELAMIKGDGKLKRKSHFTILDYDRVYIYDNNKHAVWKVYTKDDVAVFFILSSYIFEKPTTNGIKVNGVIAFYDQIEKVMEAFGANPIQRINSSEYTEYIYLKQGITFLVDDNLVRSIYIYQPKTGKCYRRWKRALKPVITN